MKSKENNMIKLHEAAESYQIFKSNLSKIDKSVFFSIIGIMQNLKPLNDEFSAASTSIAEKINTTKGYTRIVDDQPVLTEAGAKELNELNKSLYEEKRELGISVKLTEEEIQSLPQEINLAVFYLFNHIKK